MSILPLSFLLLTSVLCLTSLLYQGLNCRIGSKAKRDFCRTGWFMFIHKWNGYPENFHKLFFEMQGTNPFKTQISIWLSPVQILHSMPRILEQTEDNHFKFLTVELFPDFLTVVKYVKNVCDLLMLLLRTLISVLTACFTELVFCIWIKSHFNWDNIFSFPT